MINARLTSTTHRFPWDSRNSVLYCLRVNIGIGITAFYLKSNRQQLQTSTHDQCRDKKSDQQMWKCHTHTKDTYRLLQYS